MRIGSLLGSIALLSCSGAGGQPLDARPGAAEDGALAGADQRLPEPSADTSAPFADVPVVIRGDAGPDQASDLADAEQRPDLATPAETRKRIFHNAHGQTGSLHRGTGQALATADRDCTEVAARRGYGGTWKAWLSTSTEDAIDRIVGEGPWYRIDRTTMLFADRAQLRRGPLVPIDTTTTGDRNRFWTGSLADGTRSAHHCQDWTTFLSPHEAHIGLVDVAGSGWAPPEKISCGAYLATLCIEQ